MIFLKPKSVRHSVLEWSKSHYKNHWIVRVDIMSCAFHEHFRELVSEILISCSRLVHQSTGRCRIEEGIWWVLLFDSRWPWLMDRLWMMSSVFDQNRSIAWNISCAKSSGLRTSPRIPSEVSNLMEFFALASVIRTSQLMRYLVSSDVVMRVNWPWTSCTYPFSSNWSQSSWNLVMLLNKSLW